MESRSLRNCLNGKGSIRHLPGAGPRPVQIVIVDADDEMRFILQRVLEQSGRYKCVGSHISAEEAIREVPGASPDLVLKEIRLPDISGIECMRSLKMVLPQLVVVFVSGLGDVETMSDALAAGGDGYLTKPFDERVRAHTGG